MRDADVKTDALASCAPWDTVGTLEVKPVTKGEAMGQLRRRVRMMAGLLGFVGLLGLACQGDVSQEEGSALREQRAHKEAEVATVTWAGEQPSPL